MHFALELRSCYSFLPFYFVINMLLPFAQEYPSTLMEKEDQQVTVALPDPEKGYYRSIRFDWSGIITQWKKGSHTFVGELKRPHNPLRHDGAAGPVAEFDMNGNESFQEAKENEPFYKIGVGILLKQGEAYHFFHNYPVQKFLPWNVKIDSERIEFIQSLDGLRGWAWVYRKTLSWSTQQKNTLVMTHEIHNIGEKTITTEYYNHTMFIFDEIPIGNTYQLTIPMAIQFPLKDKMKEKVTFSDPTTLTFTEEILKGTFWTEVEIPPAEKQKLDPIFSLRVPKKGLALHFHTDYPLARMAIYAEKTACCPEPFMQIRIEPQKRVQWSIGIQVETL